MELVPAIDISFELLQARLQIWNTSLPKLYFANNNIGRQKV